MMHLYKEAKAIVDEAIWEVRQNGDPDNMEEEAREFIHQTCDGHEVAIYYSKAIQFCAEQNTSEGEQWLEDCDSLIVKGDSFGSIACRIAFATLLVECERVLAETLEELESE